MGSFLQGFLDNESSFGRLMTRCGIIIGANLMFILFSMPVITMGVVYTALYHVMLKVLRGDGVLNPFKQFWIGFKTNFRQSTICWLALLALVLFGYVDVSFCRQAGGVLLYFMYAIYALGITALIIALFLFPTMAAFANTIPHLIRNALFFAIQRPFRLIVMLFFNVFPLYLTYTDIQMQPLYAFMWCMFGFGAIALLGAALLLPSFTPYLPPVDACGDFILDMEEEERWADSKSRNPEEGSTRKRKQVEQKQDRLNKRGKKQSGQKQDGQKKSDAEILKEMEQMGM